MHLVLKPALSLKGRGCGRGVLFVFCGCLIELEWYSGHLPHRRGRVAQKGRFIICFEMFCSELCLCQYSVVFCPLTVLTFLRKLKGVITWWYVVPCILFNIIYIRIMHEKRQNKHKCLVCWGILSADALEIYYFNVLIYVSLYFIHFFYKHIFDFQIRQRRDWSKLGL